MAKLKDKPVKLWNQEDIYRYFSEKGILESELTLVRRTRPRAEGIINAAQLCVDNDFLDFSGIDLALMIFENNLGSEEGYHKNKSYMYQILGRMFEDQKDVIADLRCPLSHMVRVEVGGNQSNLHTLKGYEMQDGRFIKTRDYNPYPSLRASEADWREGVTIPLPEELDEKIACLFGNIWPASTISSTDEFYKIRIHSKEARRIVMERRVVPLLKDVFGVDFHKVDEEGSFRDVELQGVSYVKGSSAIASFLMNYHNYFNSDGEREGLPNIDWNTEFVKEFISGWEELCGGENEGRTRLYGKGILLGNSLRNLLNENDHNTNGPYSKKDSRDGQYWEVYFT